jgi:hypothetical protein
MMRAPSVTVSSISFSSTPGSSANTSRPLSVSRTSTLGAQAMPWVEPKARAPKPKPRKAICSCVFRLRFLASSFQGQDARKNRTQGGPVLRFRTIDGGPVRPARHVDLERPGLAPGVLTPCTRNRPSLP